MTRLRYGGHITYLKYSIGKSFNVFVSENHLSTFILIIYNFRLKLLWHILFFYIKNISNPKNSKVTVKFHKN